jgi:uncharacterized coiled-coil protein SlyX
MPESDQRPSIEKRVVAIEESMMHLEHLLKQLNDVICSVQQRLDKQDAALAQLTEFTKQLGNRDDRKRTAEEDRPPHY